MHDSVHPWSEPSLCLHLIAQPIETIHAECDHIMGHYSEVT